MRDVRDRGQTRPLESGTTREQAREKAYQTLKAWILQGYYRPAHHLVEQSLADRLNVSKTPVREALSRLEQEGLVESFAHRGFFVKEYSERDVHDIYELREIYERACARITAQRPDHRELASRLESVNACARAAFLDGRMGDVHRHFAHYDEIIFAQSDNRLLQEELSRIIARIHLSGVVTSYIPGRIETSLRQHDEIVAAIRTGDPAAAEERTGAHIRSLMEDALAQSAARPRLPGGTVYG